MVNPEILQGEIIAFDLRDESTHPNKLQKFGKIQGESQLLSRRFVGAQKAFQRPLGREVFGDFIASDLVMMQQN